MIIAVHFQFTYTFATHLTTNMYYFVYGLLYLLSLLPWFIIYAIADFVYVIIYYVLKYRRDIVMQNLSIAFPEKSEEEKKIIAKEFYHNLVDAFIETVKMLSITKKELQKRVMGPYENLNNLHGSGQNVQIHLGHFFNWELGSAALASKSLYPILVVYMPVKNKIFDRLFLHLRSRFGNKMIAATKFKEEFLPYKSKAFALALVGDQNPGVPQKAYWSPFFGKMAPFVTGPEKGAKTNNAIVLMSNVYKVKRGHYAFELELLTKEPHSMKEGEITRRFIDFVEESVRRHPANYLWSHRRWKHEFDAEKYKDLII